MSADTMPAEKPLVATPKIIEDYVLSRSPFARDMGTRVIACVDGYAELEVAAKPELTQHHGFLHGGVLATMADNVCCWAAGSQVGDVLTVTFSIDFLAPGRGQRFVAKGQMVKATRQLAMSEAKVYAYDGDKETLVATAKATLLRTAVPVQAEQKKAA